MHYLKQELYEQIRQSPDIFDFIQENALDGLWYWDLENPEHEWMNPRFWQVLGYSPEEMPHLVSTWQNIIHPDDLEVAKVLIGRHLEDPSQPYEQEIRYKHKQGHTVWIRCKGTAIRDASGKPVRVLGTHIDITKTKQDALKTAQETRFLKSVYDNQSIFIVEIDRNGNYTFVNNYYRDFFLWDDKNLIGISSKLGIVAEDAAKFEHVAITCFGEPGKKVKIELSKVINGIRSTALWEFICLPNPDNNDDSRLLGIGYDITEQKLTEEHLQRVSLLLNDAQRIAKMGAWDLDLTTGDTFWTDEVYTIHEVDKDFDHNKENGIQFYHPDYQSVITNAIQDAIEKQQAFNVTCRFITAKGNHRWVQASGYPVAERGKVTRLIGMFQDVTQLEEDKEAIRREQQFSQKLLENMADGFSVIDARQEQVIVNPALCRMTGFTAEELLGRFPPYPYWPTDELSKIEAAFQNSLATGEGFYELVLCRKNGEKFPVLISIGSIKNAAGEITNYFAGIKDISERKKAEEELRNNRDQFQSLVDNIPGITYRCKADKQWTMLYMSSQVDILSGYPASDFIGNAVRSYASVQHPDDLPRIYQQTSAAIEADKPYELEYRIIHRDGNIRWAYEKGVAVKNTAGEIAYLDGFILDITARKIAEQELIRTKNFLDQTNQVALVGGWEYTVREGTITWTDIIRKIHEVPDGYVPTYEEMLSFYTPESRIILQKAIERCIEYGIPYDLELNIITTSGRKIWARGIGNAEFKDDTCVRLYGTFQDIDQQKQVTLQLEESRRTMASIFEEMTDVVWSMSYPDLKTIFVTPSVERLYGYPLEDWLHDSNLWEQVIHPADRHLLPVMFEELASQQWFSKNYRIVTIDGKTKWVHNKGRIITDTQGNPIRLDGHVSDISAQYEAEQMLNAISQSTAELLSNDDVNDTIRKSLALIGTSIDADHVCYFSVVNIDNKPHLSHEYTWFNNPQRQPQIKDESFQPIPLHSDEVISRQILAGELMQGFTRAIPANNILYPLLADRNVKSFITVPICHEEQTMAVIGFSDTRTERIWKEQSIKLLSGFADSIATAIDRKQLEKSLEESRRKAEDASRAKSEFLANMSHEIRTPLNSVIGFSELLIRTQMSNTQQQYIKAIHQSGNTLLDLINDILDLSKIEAGKMELAAEKTDLYKLGSQVAEMLRFKTNEKHLELLLRIPPQTPRYAWIDVVRLKQILINLLSNAVKFTHQGEIEICIAPVPNTPVDHADMQWLEFSVRDTGIGIAPDRQQQIFEAFAQADSSTTRKYGGTGLGLTISNQLLAMMGSRLQLESSPNKGSRFFFRLLLKTTGATELSRYNFPFKKALIVEDNLSSGRILQDMLASKGITADLTEDGMSALKTLSKSTSHYDIVFIDYDLPFMDGVDIIRQIREKLENGQKQMPIVLMHSDNLSEQVQELCKRYHIYVKCSKPMSEGQLMDSLEQISGNSELIEIPDMTVHPPDTSIAYDAKTSILITDDHELNRLLAENIIHLLIPEAHILQAANGIEAIELTSRYKPDLILMDVQMPEMSGYEVTQRLKGTESLQHIPIIALTAGTTPEEQEKCKQSGMDDYMSKPIDINRLKKTFEQWLPQRDATTVEASSRQADEQASHHFNREKLLSNVGGSIEILEQLLQLVREGSMQRGIDQLKAAITENKPSQYIAEQAHLLKGSAATLCFEQLTKLAEKMEYLTDFTSLEAKQVLQQIEEEFASIQLILQR